MLVFGYRRGRCGVALVGRTRHEEGCRPGQRAQTASGNGRLRKAGTLVAQRAMIYSTCPLSYQYAVMIAQSGARYLWRRGAGTLVALFSPPRFAEMQHVRCFAGFVSVDMGYAALARGIPR